MADISEKPQDSWRFVDFICCGHFRVLIILHSGAALLGITIYLFHWKLNWNPTKITAYLTKKRMSRNVSGWIGTCESLCSSSALYFGLSGNQCQVCCEHTKHFAVPLSCFRTDAREMGGQEKSDLLPKFSPIMSMCETKISWKSLFCGH